MPAQAKGVRLWLRPARADASGNHSAVWLILDGTKQSSTRCGPDNLEGAQEALHKYLGETRLATAAKQGARSPRHIELADVIALYAQDVVPGHARPHETAARLQRLLGWWGKKRLADVNGPNCRAYAKSRSKGASRRELEELRAAINHHRNEGLCAEIVEVVLPAKGPSRSRWCTRSEVAHLLWAAWRFREIQKGTPSARRTRRHVARFILVALYTGSRAGVVCAAALEPTPGHGWIDLDRGIFFRRPEGEQETKKRKPPVPLPDRLLAHLRRWKRMGQMFAVEFNGKPVQSIDKAFHNAARDAGLPDVSPHILRHTLATWLMQLKADPRESAEYLGMTQETLNRVYGHHHPDHLKGPREAIDRRRTGRAA
jgi:integrase